MYKLFTTLLLLILYAIPMAYAQDDPCAGQTNSVSLDCLQYISTQAKKDFIASHTVAPESSTGFTMPFKSNVTQEIPQSIPQPMLPSHLRSPAATQSQTSSQFQQQTTDTQKKPSTHFNIFQ